MAACTKLTELTIIYPHPDDAKSTETGDRLDMAGTAHFVTLELVNACKTLQDINTIQIVHFLPGTGDRLKAIGIRSTEPLNRALREEVRSVRDEVIDCLKRPEMGYRERERRNKITLRVIELNTDHPRLYLGPVEVEECEV